MQMNLGSLPSIAIALVIFSVVLGIGSTVVENVRDSNLPSGYNASNPATFSIGVNATTSGLDGLSTMADYQTTIAIVAVATVVVGIIMVFFGRR